MRLLKTDSESGYNACMNDVDFFNQMVMPAVDEFSQHPGDIRLGTQACQWLQNMCDHYFYHNQSDSLKVDSCTNRDQFRATIRKTDWATEQVTLIANGTKHARSRFFDLHLERGVCGIMRCGFPMSTAHYVFIDEENAWLLYQLTEYVAKGWSQRLGLS